MVLWSAETGRVSEDMANVMELAEDAALECLVRRCIEHLKKTAMFIKYDILPKR